jgi:septal ring factor EnvC (AmiA/AmiB activator)
VFASTGLLAQQTDRSNADALAGRAADRLEGLQREADQLATEERTILNELRRLELERRIRTEESARLDVEAKTAGAELEATTSRLDELEARDAIERSDLRARLVEIYKLGGAGYLRLFLSTSDAGQVGRASRIVGALAQADRQHVAERRRTIESLRAARRDLDSKSRRMRALRGDAERLARAASDAARVQNDLVRDIDRRRDLNAQFAGELLAAQQRLQVTVRTLSSGAARSDPALLPLRPFRGVLDWPVSGPIRRRFGKGSAAGANPSNGVEIAAQEGMGVRAVHDGIVAYAEPFAGFGNLVIVDHGAQALTVYGDLLDVAVKRGARIERGQLVGTVGPTPVGPAGLYFELRIDGQPVDPLQWLKQK